MTLDNPEGHFIRMKPFQLKFLRKYSTLTIIEISAYLNVVTLHRAAMICLNEICAAFVSKCHKISPLY